MIRNPKIISLERRRPKPPIPLIVVLGMPEGNHSIVVQKWMRSQPRQKTVYLNPASLDDPDTQECPQCILLEKTLGKLQETLKLNCFELEEIWLEAPLELNPRKLIEELTRVPEIRLAAVTTWIDSIHFLRDFSSDQEWQDRIQGTSQTISLDFQQEPFLETWIDQLEFCNAHLLMGLDDLPRKEQESILTILRTLQPEAIQIRADQVSDWGKDSFYWNLFDSEKIYNSCAWKQMLASKKPSPHLFRSKRPFHPGRLNALIEEWPEVILRSFGTVWLSSHNHMALTLSQTGPAGFFFSPEGYWIGTLTSADQRFALQEHPELLSDWDKKFGDRMTELAFVSTEPLGQDWIQRLESCVLNDIEMRMDWSKFPNPFPTFEHDEGDGDETSELAHSHEKSIVSRKVTHLRLLAGDSE